MMKKIAAVILTVIAVWACKKETPTPTPDNLSLVGWAVGNVKNSYGIVAKTVDGGRSWIAQTASGDFPRFDIGGVVALNDNTCLIDGTLMDNPEGRIYKTSDGGNSWKRVAAGMQFETPKICITSAGDGNIWGAVQDFVIHSADGGENWTKTKIVSKAGMMFVPEQLATCDGVNIYIGGECSVSYDIEGYVAVYYSNDAGKSWKMYEFPDYPGSVIDISSPNGNTVYMVGSRGFAAKTGNNFQTVTFITGISGSSSLNDFNGIYAIDANRALAAIDYGGIYYTADGGISWRKGAGEAINHGCAVMKALLLQDAQHGTAVAVPLSGVEYGQILYTEDGGANWIEPKGGVQGTFWGVSFVQVKRK